MSDLLHNNVITPESFEKLPFRLSYDCGHWLLLDVNRCVLVFTNLANMILAKFTGRLSGVIRNFIPLHRIVFTLLPGTLILMPCSIYANDQASNVMSRALSRDDTTAVEERTLDATEGRTKAQESVNALSSDIQELKQSVIALNKNLRVLEEDLLFPANTQVNVFLSLDVGKFFTLESVKLKLDGQVVASHIYTDKELLALARSGIHKLHMANLSIGEHTLSAFFTGIGPSGREYKRGTTLNINKESGPKYIELKIADSSMKLQPEFSVKEW